MMNLESHAFMPDIFVAFDRDADGLVDFNEYVRGLDIMETGTFNEKCNFCYGIYDVYGLGTLDIFTLR